MNTTFTSGLEAGLALAKILGLDSQPITKIVLTASVDGAFTADVNMIVDDMKLEAVKEILSKARPKIKIGVDSSGKTPNFIPKQS